jgi:hypothetical protein
MLHIKLGFIWARIRKEPPAFLNIIKNQKLMVNYALSSIFHDYFILPKVE